MVVKPERIASVDVLRGLVMVVMTLDHARDWFSNAAVRAEDVARTWPALFFTRWITHFCAPTFVFLTGIGIGLSQRDDRPIGVDRRFLIKRGLWLILMELTLCNASWGNQPWTPTCLLQVIWVIGVSMIACAVVMTVPKRALAVAALVVIVGHDAFDDVTADSLGRWGPLWILAHESSFIPISETYGVFVLYPLIPWIAVLILGFASTPLFRLAPATRVRALAAIGGAAVVGFAALRWWDGYGDPSKREAFADPMRTLMSFLNTSKYPPSLAFLLMTIGPALLVLAALDRVEVGRVLGVLRCFGGVPLFYYLAHVPLIATAAIVTNALAGGGGVPNPIQIGEGGWGFGLPVVYAVWVLAVLVLYPACRRYGAFKRRTKAAWVRYL